MNALVQSNIKKVQLLCEQHFVKSLAIFGSAVSNTMSNTSDVDCLVRFTGDVEILKYADNFFSLKRGLEKIFGRDVDLVSEKTLKNPVFIDEIRNSKVVVYES